MSISKANDAGHRCEDLVCIFNSLFRDAYSTVLEGGADEPIYLPATLVDSDHRILFTRDYYASALHEISHWCIAGKSRRQQVDYGYWYEPDGRSLEQQRVFESVEVEPQALEWVFSAAAGITFRVSADNLNGEAGDASDFAERVRCQVVRYLAEELPVRAKEFCQALTRFYGREAAFQKFRNDMMASLPCHQKPVAET